MKVERQSASSSTKNKKSRNAIKRGSFHSAQLGEGRISRPEDQA